MGFYQLQILGFLGLLSAGVARAELPGGDTHRGSREPVVVGAAAGAIAGSTLANGVPTPPGGAPGAGGTAQGVAAPEAASIATGDSQLNKETGVLGVNADDSEARAKKNFESAGFDREVSKRERATYDSLNRDYENYRTNIQPLLYHSRPEQRARGEEMLGQRLSPPPQVAPVYEKVGLSTYRDIQENAERYMENAKKDADARDKEADKLTDDAQKGIAAANKMRDFQKTVSQRNDHLDSMNENSVASTANNLKNNSNVYNLGRGRSHSDDTSDSDLKTKITAQDDATASQKIKSDSLPAKSETSYANAVANSKSKQDELAARLRAALAEAANKKENAAKGPGRAPASAFDGIFADSKSGDKNGEGAVVGGTGNSKVFHMSEVETDKAVKGLIDNLNGGASAEDRADREIYGNLDVTIFARMKKVLTKAQVEKRL